MSEALGGRAVADDVEARLAEQPHDALPQKDIIVGDYHPRGRAARWPLAAGGEAGRSSGDRGQGAFRRCSCAAPHRDWTISPLDIDPVGVLLGIAAVLLYR